MEAELKHRLLKLLKEDEEFRYAVAGLIGLEEVLKRLEEHDRKFNEILERLDRHEAELAKLREDMNKGFERHDRELARLREEMMKGFERYDRELARLREDMNRGFERYDQESAKLREDMMMGFERYDRELTRLREDMNKGFELLRRHIDALGARWGLLAEEAFREGLKGIVRELGLEVERWVAYDREGLVYGHPSTVEVDVAIKDGQLVLVEISSHVRPSDLAAFKRKADFYARETGRKPDRLIMITPFAEEEALRMAEEMGITIYTKV